MPKKTMALTFRHLLEKNDLGEQIFETASTNLIAQEMKMR